MCGHFDQNLSDTSLLDKIDIFGGRGGVNKSACSFVSKIFS